MKAHTVDIAVIGAGVTGCAVARELTRYDGSVLVLERAEDVCCGTSKANSAIVHAGFDAKHGSLMAKYNMEGSRMMGALARELDFPFERNGSLVLCFSEQDMPRLRALYENGVQNGVEGLEIISGARAREMEPNLTDEVVAALYAPTGGIVCPFTLTLALAENAVKNGAQFRLGTEVKSVTRVEDGYLVQTDAGVVHARCVVNAAGLYADVFHNMVARDNIRLTPRKGDYYLLDRSVGGIVKRTIFQLPGKYGKGVLVSPTVHGNVIVGPTAVDIDDREGVNTTAAGLAEAAEKAALSVKNLPLRQVITSFAGLRAHEDRHDFIIGQADGAPGFFDCAGIESPGLSSAPAIGRDVAAMVAEYLSLGKNAAFDGTRKGILRPSELGKSQRAALISAHSEYGQIICRCESVTEGEILDAIRRPLGARSLDGVKRRTRAGMGRCQAGFCSPRVMELLARELGVGMDEITKSGGKSRLIVGTAKDRL